VAVIAASVWAVGTAQRDAVTRSFEQSRATQSMVTAMLDQENGLRGYLQTGQREFLEPFDSGQVRFAEAVDAARESAPGREQRVLVDRAAAAGREWRASARRAIERQPVTGVRRIPLREAVQRKAIMDRFRALADRTEAAQDADRDRGLRRATLLSVLVIVGLGALFGGGGWLFVGRRAAARARREAQRAARREEQMSFARALQVMDGEADAHRLIERHLERSLPGARVTVIDRAGSSCLAGRLGRGHEQGADEPLLACARCGGAGAALTTCTPLIIRGETVASVLIAHARRPTDEERLYVTEAVTHAGPVIANMRSLELARRRAATDPLTGLPNRRAIQDAFDRMLVEAADAGTSLTALVLDLDRFKQVNDRYGHEKGDDVLTAAARAMVETLRESDVVGRLGGEEFVVLAPETGLDGALVAAENLRRAIAELDVPGVDRPITTSVGVAVFPEDAADAGGLLRQADRALYAAKRRGRDRVETAAALAPAAPAAEA
jgi:diguanylate cyclase (GGDEF)-like protein